MLNHKIAGDGAQTIIFLHGLYASSANWSGITRYLSNDYRCVSVDLRNHGDSPHEPSMSYLDMANDVVELIQHLDLEQTAIVGHSMGGKTAMTLALQNPQLVSHLVLEDIAPVAYEHGHYEMNKALRDLDLATLESRQEADEQLASTIEQPRVRQFLLTNLLGKPGAWRWRINLENIAENLHHILSMPSFAPNTTFSQPTLLAYGEDSDYFMPTEHQAATQALFPNLQLVGYANTEHWVHALHPKKFCNMIVNFIS